MLSSSGFLNQMHVPTVLLAVVARGAFDGTRRPWSKQNASPNSNIKKIRPGHFWSPPCMALRSFGDGHLRLLITMFSAVGSKHVAANHEEPPRNRRRSQWAERPGTFRGIKRKRKPMGCGEICLVPWAPSQQLIALRPSNYVCACCQNGLRN